MHACSYVNVVAGSVLVALVSFGGCAEGGPSGSSPPPSEPAAISSAPAASSAPASSASSPPAGAPQQLAAKEAPPDRTANDIGAIVSSHRAAFRDCYDRSQSAHPGIEGSFWLTFVLNPDGSLKSAETNTQKSQIHAPDLETCAVAALRALKFPASRQGKESTINYPFDFHPRGGTPKVDAGSP